MKQLGIKALNRFLKRELTVEVLEKYWDFQIFSEADLQSIVWKLLSEFITKANSKPGEFLVLNKPYLRGLGIHPDIVVFRDRQPWVVIELKERRVLEERSARKELRRLLKTRVKLRAQKGYLLYVARYGDGRVLKGPKGKAARFFCEIPIILEAVRPKESIRRWERVFRYWARYDGE